MSSDGAMTGVPRARKQASLAAVLSGFFAEASNICASEATFQALFHHHLLARGVPCARIARDFGEHGTDIAFAGQDMDSGHGSTPAIAAAFQLKGGARGAGNALEPIRRQTRELDHDLKRLAELRAAGAQTMFVCIDVAQLGTQFTDTTIEEIAARTRAAGVGFAYYRSGADHYAYCVPDGAVARNAVPAHASARIRARAPATVKLDAQQPVAYEMGDLVNRLRDMGPGLAANDATCLGLLYHQLRSRGIGVDQVSLDTEFNFAAMEITKMQWRPALTVFSADSEGDFSLFKDAGRTVSADECKLAALRTAVAVKVGASREGQSESAVALTYRNDIEKLRRWHEALTAGAGKLGVTLHPGLRFEFLAVDNTEQPLSDAARDSLISAAQAAQAHFHYAHLPIEPSGSGLVHRDSSLLPPAEELADVTIRRIR